LAYYASNKSNCKFKNSLWALCHHIILRMRKGCEPVNFQVKDNPSCANQWFNDEGKKEEVS